VESEAELNHALAHESIAHRVGVLLPADWTALRPDVTVLSWGSWSDPGALARDLYHQLRALDDLGVEVIVCPLPPADGIGLAIRDRLRKAAK